jgi:hypothetical protein
MHYTQYTTVKGLVDERLRRASVHRLKSQDAEERDGPMIRLRHRAGHALVAAGEFVAHGVGHTAVHTARHLRPTE